MWLPGVAAFAGAILLAAVDLVGLVMGSWDSPAPGLGWLKAGAIGQCGVAAAAAAVLVAGAARPGLAPRRHRDRVGDDRAGGRLVPADPDAGQL